MKKITSLREIERITSADKNSMKEFLVLFIYETSLRIEEIKEQVKSNNWDELKKLAHKTKSSLNIVGMNTYLPIAEDLEQKAGMDPEKTKEQAKLLYTVLAQAVSELESNLKKLNK